MIKVNRKKSGIYKKLDKLKKRAQRAHMATVTTGINKGEGMHPSGIKYADLLVIHHNGIPSKGIPSRPVLHIVRSLYFKAVSKLGKREFWQYLDGQQSLDHTLTSIGKVSLKYTKDVFGSTMLASNAPNTIAQKGGNNPLIETGNLYTKLSYRYTWQGGESGNQYN